MSLLVWMALVGGRTVFGKGSGGSGGGGGGEVVVVVAQSRESEADGDRVSGGAPWRGSAGISAKSFISRQ